MTAPDRIPLTDRLPEGPANAGLSQFGAPIQNGIVLYAQRVSSQNHVEAVACNLSGTTMTPISGLPVRVVTFG